MGLAWRNKSKDRDKEEKKEEKWKRDGRSGDRMRRTLRKGEKRGKGINLKGGGGGLMKEMCRDRKLSSGWKMNT